MLIYILVLLTGVAAGFLNTVAGGGSLLSLPILTFLGLGIDVANGTNRIAILMQNIAATYRFRKSGINVSKEIFQLGIPTLFGAALGATIAINLNKELLEKVIAVILIVLAILLVFRPKMWSGKEPKKEIPKIAQYLVFFGLGVYGGFIQAGIGFFLITAIVLVKGFDLVRTNAVKVGVIALYTVLSLIIFFIGGKVDLLLGLVLGVGNSLGGILGAQFSVKKGSKWIRIILFATVTFSALKMLLS
ncbi:MAG: uncharacterized protein PWQ20_267 [Thermotogaceae bacterium]|nr:uncharacterized protein [Thermotogaceae bacterium]MDN5337197.1 uncharacterized protein [Thermotogaceae bacterium]